MKWGCYSTMVYYRFAEFWRWVEITRERLGYLEVYEKLYRRGWRYKLSFYGRLKKPVPGPFYECRVEVLSKRPFEPWMVHALYMRFATWEPDAPYIFFLVWRVDGYRIHLKRLYVS